MPLTTLFLLSGRAGYAYDPHAFHCHSIAVVLSPTMDDLSRQIEACKGRIANVRTLIGMMRATGEPTARAEQQLAREMAFLRTLEDIRSEKDSAALEDAADTPAPPGRSRTVQ
jgi:hypothetical protein